ncbi:MAG TPA: hypothetical protein PKY08_03380 [Candidatus Magasanikbacteria bacterium]|nr:hypothetical protein [Candidatus Magasanikbacteria bacterium]
MGNFNRGDRHGGDRRGGGFRGGRGFGGGRKFGGSAPFGGRQSMFQAVCGKCQKECEVPFKPTDDRPVLCNECFREQGQGRGERSDRPRQDFGRSNFGEEQKQRIASSQNIEQFRGQFEVLNVKLDKILKMLAPNPVISTVEEKVEKEPVVKTRKTKAVEEKIKSSIKKKVAAKKKK